MIGAYAPDVPRPAKELRTPVGSHGPFVIANLKRVFNVTSITVIAETTGVHISTLSKWDNDWTRPDPKKVEQCAKAVLAKTGRTISVRDLITQGAVQDLVGPEEKPAPESVYGMGRNRREDSPMNRRRRRLVDFLLDMTAEELTEMETVLGTVLNKRGTKDNPGRGLRHRDATEAPPGS